MRLRRAGHRDVVAAEVPRVRGRRARHAGGKQAGLLEERKDGDEPPVAAAEDPDARRVDVGEGLHVVHSIRIVVQIAAPPVEEELLAEGAAISGAAAGIELY